MKTICISLFRDRDSAHSQAGFTGPWHVVLDDRLAHAERWGSLSVAIRTPEAAVAATEAMLRVSGLTWAESADSGSGCYHAVALVDDAIDIGELPLEHDDADSHPEAAAVIAATWQKQPTPPPADDPPAEATGARAALARLDAARAETRPLAIEESDDLFEPEEPDDTDLIDDVVDDEDAPEESPAPPAGPPVPSTPLGAVTSTADAEHAARRRDEAAAADGEPDRIPGFARLHTGQLIGQLGDWITTLEPDGRVRAQVHVDEAQDLLNHRPRNHQPRNGDPSP